MTTKLTEPVFRETTIEIDGRALILGLAPASESPPRPETIIFRLKGKHEKSDRHIPVPLLVRLVGWEKPVAADEQRLSPTEEIKRLFQQPELVALEQQVLAQTATPKIRRRAT